VFLAFGTLDAALCVQSFKRRKNPRDIKIKGLHWRALLAPANAKAASRAVAILGMGTAFWHGFGVYWLAGTIYARCGVLGLPDA
jgi:hypothetical protein